MMKQSTLQIMLAIAMFFTTAIAGFIPVKLLKHMTNGKWLSLLICFSGGVFMGTCFLDIIPHIEENYQRFLQTTNVKFSYPVPQFFICLGFFIVYLIEEFCMKVFSMSHDHSHEDKPQIESPNLRRCEDPLLISNDEKLEDTTMNIHSMVRDETANYAVAEPEEGSLLKSLTFAIAMSFHSLLEGFALGVQDTQAGILALFISLILHKGIEAFSVGIQITKGNKNKTKQVIFTILIYSLMTPIGSGLGTLLQLSNIGDYHKYGATFVLEALAGGTFIYVTFLEVLAHEKDNKYNSLKQLLAIFLGFATIAALQFLFEGHGGHEHASPGDAHHEHENLHVEPSLLSTLVSPTRL